MEDAAAGPIEERLEYADRVHRATSPHCTRIAGTIDTLWVSFQRTAPGFATAFAFAILAAISSGCAGNPSVSTQEPLADRALTERHAFTDDVAVEIQVSHQGMRPKSVRIDDASHYKVVEATVEPGEMLPWHSHPGSVLVAVTSGELVYVDAENCGRRSYQTATAFVDLGFDHVHMAYDPSEDSETVVATYLGVPAEDPLTEPVEEARNAELDARCGIDR